MAQGRRQGRPISALRPPCEQAWGGLFPEGRASAPCASRGWGAIGDAAGIFQPLSIFRIIRGDNGRLRFMISEARDLPSTDSARSPCRIFSTSMSLSRNGLDHESSRELLLSAFAPEGRFRQDLECRRTVIEENSGRCRTVAHHRSWSTAGATLLPDARMTSDFRELWT